MTVAYRCDLLAYRCGGSVGIELLPLVRVAPTSRLILLSAPADPEAARRVVADSKTPEAGAMVGDYGGEGKFGREREQGWLVRLCRQSGVLPLVSGS